MSNFIKADNSNGGSYIILTFIYFSFFNVTDPEMNHFVVHYVLKKKRKDEKKSNIRNFQIS